MDFSQFASEFLAYVSDLSSPVIYCTIVGILLTCGMGLPIPEDITLLVAGLLAATGKISLPGAIAAGFLGVIAGDSILFSLGRRYGKRVFRLPGLRHIFTPERQKSAEDKIRKNGPFICFIARFLPGLRSAIFAMSGALGVKRSTFILLDGLAAALSVPLWIFVGHWFGKNFDDALGGAMAMAQKVQSYILLGLGCLIVAYVAIKFWRRGREIGGSLPDDNQKT